MLHTRIFASLIAIVAAAGCASGGGADLIPTTIDGRTDNLGCLENPATFLVKNQGTEDAAATSTAVTFQPSGSDVSVTQSVYTPAIAAGSEQTMSVPWPASQCHTPDCYIRVEVNSVRLIGNQFVPGIPEANADNNSVYGICVG